MTQNINLLTELAIQPISAFNSRLMERIIVGWILALIVIYAIAFGVDWEKKRNLVTAEALQKKLLAKVASYNEILAPFREETYSADSENLPASSGSITGFHNHLKDLAIFTPSGVWLNHIIISETDGLSTLEGSTVASSGVSALLDALSKSNSFRNKKFNTIRLEKNPETGNTDFTISNVIIAAPANNKKQ
jgi:hypothetical protein